MTEETTITFDSETFADYWEARTDDERVGQAWMEEQLQTEAGKELLSGSATILVRRHGASSGYVQTFRTQLGRAAKKVGLDPTTIGLDKEQDEPTMVVMPVKRDGRGRKVDHAKKIRTAVRNAVEDSGDTGMSFDDVRSVVSAVLDEY